MIVADDATELIGTSIDHFELQELIGVGGMGTVYAAHDRALARTVAIKLMAAGDRSPPGRARLLDEARAMARLAHPNVLSVFEVGEHGGGIYIAMEYAPTGTLGDWLRACDRSWRDVLTMVIAAGRGLAAAHAAGIVHRDFKPANVLIGVDERPRVGDFGIARAAPTTASPARGPIAVTSVAGTPAYMSPEQHLGREVDAQSDQFAFCVTAWEALCGVRPFVPLVARDATTATAIAGAVISGRIEPPPRGRTLPPRLLAALRRGMAVDPDARWPSMAALLGELERCARRRHPAAWLYASAAVIAVVAIVAVVAWVRFGARHVTTPVSDPGLVALVRDLDLDHPIEVAGVSALRGDSTTLADGRIVVIRNSGIDVVDDRGELHLLATPPRLIPTSVAAIGNDDVLVFGRDVDDVRKTRLWRVALATGRQTLELEDDGALVEPGIQGGRMRASRDGRRVVFANAHQLVLLDRTTGERSELLSVSDDHALICPAWSPDGRSLFYIHGQPGATRMERIDLDDRKPRVVFDGHSLVDPWMTCSAMSFRGDGLGVVTEYASSGPRGWLVSLRGDRPPAAIADWPRSVSTGVAVEADRLVTGEFHSEGAGGIGQFAFDRPTSLPIPTLDVAGKAHAIVGALPDGRIVFWRERDGQHAVATTDGATVQDWQPVGARPVAIAGDRILAVHEGRVLALSDPDHHVVLGTTEAIGVPRCSRAGCVALKLGPHATVNELDVTRGTLGKQITAIDQPLAKPYMTALSPAGDRLAIGGTTPTVSILDLRDGSIRRLSAHLAYAVTPNWLDDDTLVVTGVGLGTISFAVVRIDVRDGTVTPLLASDNHGMAHAAVAGNRLVVAIAPVRTVLRVYHRKSWRPR